MKKLIILAIIFVVSCQKYPDLNRLNNDYFIQTGFDHSVDFKLKFNSLNTYYMPDSIRLISDAENDSIWSDNHSQTILNAIANKLDANNYQRITDSKFKNTAAIGIMVTHISNLKYANSPENAWWQKHRLYWDSKYWGWKVLYYPYGSPKNQAMEALLVEMVDLSHPVNDSVAVVWNMFAGGVLPDKNKNANLQNAINAVDQAFLQSPYLKLK